MSPVKNRMNRKLVQKLTMLIEALKRAGQQTYDLPFSYVGEDGNLYRSAARMYVYVVKLMQKAGYHQFAQLASQQVSLMVNPPFSKDYIQIVRNAGRLTLSRQMQKANLDAERLSAKSFDNYEIKDARGTDASSADESLRPITAGDTKALIRDAICYVHYVYCRTYLTVKNGKPQISLPTVDLRKFRAYANVIEQYRYLEAREQAEKHASQKTA